MLFYTIYYGIDPNIYSAAHLCLFFLLVPSLIFILFFIFIFLFLVMSCLLYLFFYPYFRSMNFLTEVFNTCLNVSFFIYLILLKLFKFNKKLNLKTFNKKSRIRKTTLYTYKKSSLEKRRSKSLEKNIYIAYYSFRNNNVFNYSNINSSSQNGLRLYIAIIAICIIKNLSLICNILYIDFSHSKNIKNILCNNNYELSDILLENILYKLEKKRNFKDYRSTIWRKYSRPYGRKTFIWMNKNTIEINYKATFFFPIYETREDFPLYVITTPQIRRRKGKKKRDVILDAEFF